MARKTMTRSQVSTYINFLAYSKESRVVEEYDAAADCYLDEVAALKWLEKNIVAVTPVDIVGLTYKVETREMTTADWMRYSSVAETKDVTAEEAAAFGRRKKDKNVNTDEQ